MMHACFVERAGPNFLSFHNYYYYLIIIINYQLINWIG